MLRDIFIVVFLNAQIYMINKETLSVIAGPLITRGSPYVDNRCFYKASTGDTLFFCALTLT